MTFPPMRRIAASVAARVGLSDTPVEHHAKRLITLLTNYDDHRKVVARSYAYDALGLMTPFIAVDSGPILYIVPTRDWVGRCVYVAGNFELESMRSAKIIIERETGVCPFAGRIFVDIGANIGTATLLALREFGATRALCVEPSPSNLRLLRANLAANGLNELVDVAGVALSDVNGTCVLELSPDNSGDHRVRQPTVAADRMGESGRGWIEVRVATFDSIAGSVDLDLDSVGLAWLDTQGHEGLVLAGASSLLERNIPLVVEYWPYGQERAGGLSMLHDQIRQGFRWVIDVSSLADGSYTRLPTADIASLTETYTVESMRFTDLVLLK